MNKKSQLIKSISKNKLEELKNLSLMLKDLIQGDESVNKREDYSKFNYTELKDGLDILLNNDNISDTNKKILLQESWRVVYKDKPPTIDDFVSNKYLGGTYDDLYPYIKRILLEFFDQSKPYRNLILAPHIGWGKSFLSILSNLYIATHLWLMRQPKKYLGVSDATVLSQALVSFTESKAKELLVDPFIEILNSTEIYERCKTLDSMEKKQKEFGNSKICWSTASSTSAFTFSGGTNIKIASNPSKLLGVTFITGTVSEIAFFQDRGFSQDYIWRIVNDMKGRIQNRFPGNYWARTIMDSSPNDMEGCIDQYIFGGDADKDPTNLIIRGSEWKWQPWKYNQKENSKYELIEKDPLWYKKDWIWKNPVPPEIAVDTFPVFRGSGNTPPQILSEESVEMSKYDLDQIIYVPKMREQLFKDALIKSLKDYAGFAAGAEDKLIENKEKLEGIFTNQLRNVYTNIYASAKKKPEGLIWNTIHKDFFIEFQKGRYQFYRNPNAERFISIDQSISGDVTGISMSHVELNDEGDLVYVGDFTIPIVPNKDRINLDAIKFFIKDLRDLGRLNIKKVSFDQFQSESTIQFLEREGFDVEKLSVDISIQPYLSSINLMNTGLLKVGRNIFLKNNFKSLEIRQMKTKKKVEHLIGKLVDWDGADWKKSLMGYYAKDVSDSFVASIELCRKYAVTPSYICKKEEFIETTENDSKVKGINTKQILSNMGFKI